MAWARAGSLIHYAAVARSVGLDPLRMIRRARIDPNLLSYSETHISAGAVAALLEESALESGTPDFGLRLAAARSLAEMGPISLLLSHQDTVGGAIIAFARYGHLLSDAIAISVEYHSDFAIMHVEPVLAVPFEPRQAHDYAMGAIHRALGALGGTRWLPESIAFTRQPPADPAPYRRFFSGRVVFMSDFNGFVFDRHSLEAVNFTAQLVSNSTALSYIEALLPRADKLPMHVEVAGAIRLLLPSGRGNARQVAGHLGVSLRVLQRQLGREGASFSALLNATRRDLAVGYLSTAANSVGIVATMTGFSSLASFTRWFTAEFGVAPTAWRKRAEAQRRLRLPASPAIMRYDRP